MFISGGGYKHCWWYGWDRGRNVGCRKGAGKFELRGKGRLLLGYILRGGDLTKEFCWNFDPRSLIGVNLCEKSHLLPLRQWPFLFKKGQNTRALFLKFLFLGAGFLSRLPERQGKLPGIMISGTVMTSGTVFCDVAGG